MYQLTLGVRRRRNEEQLEAMMWFMFKNIERESKESPHLKE